MDNMGTNFFSVNFLDKVIKANLNYSFIKKLLCSYGDLEKKYITSNKLELYKDLQNQKKKVLAKLGIKDNPKFGKIQASFKEIEANFDPRQIQDLPIPSYVGLTFSNSKWHIQASNSQEAPLSFKSPEDCIEYVSLVSNRDLKQAGYAMLHAKEYAPKEFILTAAEFDEEPAKDFNPEMLEETEEMEREPALDEMAQEIDVNQVYEDEAGQPHTIMAVDSDKVVDSQNNIYPRTEVEKFVAEGRWKKLASLKKKASKTLKDLGLTFYIDMVYDDYFGTNLDIAGELREIDDSPDNIRLANTLRSISTSIKELQSMPNKEVNLSDEQVINLKRVLGRFAGILDDFNWMFYKEDVDAFVNNARNNEDFLKKLELWLTKLIRN